MSSSMADNNSASTTTSSDMQMPKSVLSKIGKTAGNMRLHALSLLPICEQWNNLQSSFATEVRKIGSREEVVVEKERSVQERFVALAVREKEFEERLKVLKEREMEFVGIEERRENVELREKEIQEHMENIELREKIFEESRKNVMLREKGIQERSENVEFREKGIQERSENVELREKEIEERRENVELREKELAERRENVVLREKGIEERRENVELREKKVDERSEMVELREKGIEERRERVELMERELVERERVLESKEEAFEKLLETYHEEMRSKTGQLIERHRALVAKEKEVDEGLKAMQRISTHGKFDGCKSTEMNALESGTKPSEECRNRMGSRGEENVRNCVVLGLGRQSNQTNNVKGLKAGFVNKCSNLISKQADDVGKQHDVVGKKVKEEPMSDSCVLRENRVIESHDRVKIPVVSADALRLAKEIQLVLTDHGARATTSYLIKHANPGEDTWHQKMPRLGEEIPGVIQSLLAERKPLLAAICSCVFKMEDIYLPELLLDTHLHDIHNKAEVILKEAGATSQEEAANMELSGLRDVLHCIYDFKLESIFSPAALELRIKQLEEEMDERRTPTNRTRNPKKKRKASSKKPRKQIKHSKAGSPDV